MVDIFTGEEEKELVEAAIAYKQALSRIDPVEQPDLYAKVSLRADILDSTIEEEDPTPLLCTCNNPADVPPTQCEYGHSIGPDGYCVDGPKYIPVGWTK